jgi:hypothetical protein
MGGSILLTRLLPHLVELCKIVDAIRYELNQIVPLWKNIPEIWHLKRAMTSQSQPTFVLFS